MKTRQSAAIVFFALITSITYGQNFVIDGDQVYLRDSLELERKVTLLTSIKRGSQNPEAMWVTYNRRPGVDPWIPKSRDWKEKYSEKYFINYWKEEGITILGAFTTYDNCRCYKTKASGSPDMYLIHFKISKEDWYKMNDIYPGMEHYLRKTPAY